MSQVKDPVTGQMMTYSQLSQLMQARRQQVQAEQPYVPEGYSIVARQTKNTGPAVKGNPFDGWVEQKNTGGIIDMDDPTNRDSVPAMLTPGEYVLNKEATQMFGPQIHAMNNMGLQARKAGNEAMGYNTGGLVDFLKKHEGWRDKAYQDSAGVWTIGYGRTFNDDGTPVTKGQTTTKEAENKWIKSRAKDDYNAVKTWADNHGEDWSNKELEALASFRYNLGAGGFNQLTKDENGIRDKATIKQKLPLYVNAGGRKVDGLVNRRNYEMEHAGWGEVKAPAEGSSETSFPVVPTSEPVPPTEQSVPIVPQQQPHDGSIDLTPPEGGDQQLIPGVGGGFQDQALGILSQGLFGGGAPPMPSAGVGGMQPIKSAEEIRMMRNNGGMIPYQHYFMGGLVESLFGGGQAQDPYAGYANYNQQDFLKEAEMMNNPGAQLGGYEVPGMSTPPTMTGENMAPVPTAQPGGNLQNRGAAIANHAGNRFIMETSGSQGTFVPELDTAPPVPGSDEALLQGSSDNVERLENTAKLAKRHQEYDAIMAGAEYDPRGMNQVPTPDWQMSPEGMSVGQPVNLENIDRTPSVLEAVTGVPVGNTRGVEAYLGDVPANPSLPGLGDAAMESVPQMDMSSPVIPQNPTVPAGNPAEMGGIYEGWETATPEQIAAEAIPKDVQQADGHNIPKEPGELSSRLDDKGQIPVAEQRAAVTQKVADLGGDPLSNEEAATAENAGKNLPTEQVDKAKNIIQENFGDLFDKKELARAALLFAGAMVTGMSPGRALAFAGTQYLGRLDAKEAQKVKSAEALRKAQLKGAPTIDMTQSDRFVVDGKEVKGFKMTQTNPETGVKTTQYVDAQGSPISPSAHQNFDRVQGTPEWNKRVADESKTYSTTFKELQERFGKTDEGYITGLTPGKVGLNSAKWAAKNGVPPEAMGQLLDNAYQQALSESRGGKTVRNIEAYLNDQYIQSQVGDPSLFQDSKGNTADAEKVNGLMNAFGTQLRNLPAYQGMSDTAISTIVMQKARPLWANLPEEERKSYSRQAGPGQSGFMVFLQQQLSQ